jgi:acyl carrier protein
MYKLENVDPLDIVDLVIKLETSFHLKFNDEELKNVETFGDFCDVVTNKLEETNTNDCTTQQAFYKIRKALPQKSPLTPSTQLSELFPRKTRRQQVKHFESILGFKTDILAPKGWIIPIFILTFLASLFICYFSLLLGLSGLIFSGIAINITHKLGKELNVATLGQLAEKLSREHYLDVRRNPSTINQTEITQNIKALFKEYLDLEDDALTRDARFS